MRVHHLNCATLSPPGGRLVNGQRAPWRRARMVCHCLLIETGAGLVLVDSGFGTQDVAERSRGVAHRTSRWFMGPALDVEETAVRQIARLGFSPDEVQHVVLTHLDYDHAGGLADFPRARVHVLADEHAAAMARRTQLERLRYHPSSWAHGPQWVLHRAEGERWFGFDCVRALPGLPPEVLLVPLHGHTRGHAAVAVQTGPGWLLHAGDSYFYGGEVDPDRPRCSPGLALFQRLIQMDGRARCQNQERLRELARSHRDDVRMFSAHDPDEFARLAAGNPRAPR